MFRSKISSIVYLIMYYTFLLVLIKLNAVGSAVSVFVLGLGAWVLHIFFNITSQYLFKGFIKKNAYILIFYFAYFLITFSNISKISLGLGYLIVIIFHLIIVFFFQLKNKIFQLISLKYCFLFLSIFMVFLPVYNLTNSLEFGAFYNIEDTSLLTTTTVEGPIIVSILYLITFYDFFYKKRRTIENMLILIFSIFVLFLFNRRGMIFSSFLANAFFELIRRSQRRFVIYFSLLFLFLPIFWESISEYFIFVLDIDFINKLIVRNDRIEIAEATGRIETWFEIVNMFFSFDSNFIFGQKSGPSESLFLQVDDQAGRYSHAHNSLLQIFLEGGYISVVLFLSLLISIFELYVNRPKFNLNSSFTSNADLYLMLLLNFMILSGTETLIQGVKFSNFLFSFILCGLISSIWSEKIFVEKAIV